MENLFFIFIGIVYFVVTSMAKKADKARETTPPPIPKMHPQGRVSVQPVSPPKGGSLTSYLEGLLLEQASVHAALAPKEWVPEPTMVAAPPMSLEPTPLPLPSDDTTKRVVHTAHGPVAPQKAAVRIPRSEIQKAMVWKEILDKPVSLR